VLQVNNVVAGLIVAFTKMFCVTFMFCCFEQPILFIAMAITVPGILAVYVLLAKLFIVILAVISEDNAVNVTLVFRHVNIVGPPVTKLNEGTADCTVYVFLQPVAKFVAVKVKTPIDVDVPGLLTGVGGRVGASQPKAIPLDAAAFKVTVEPLQLINGVAIGAIVLLTILTGTVAVHILSVFVNTQ
jgi:hypothetical protein